MFKSVFMTVLFRAGSSVRKPLVVQCELESGLVDVEGRAVLHEEVPLHLRHLLQPFPPLLSLLSLHILHNFLQENKTWRCATVLEM